MTENQNSKRPSLLAIAAILLGLGAVVLAFNTDRLPGAMRPGFGAGQASLVAVGALLIAGGFALLRWPGLAEHWRTVAAVYRRFAVAAFTILALVLSVELAATILAGQTVIPVRGGALWRQIPEYASQEWVERYDQEFEQLEQNYLRYLLWRTEPFEGETILVDDEGVRRTPGASADPDALRVFTFGGSALWGSGSPDDRTIPAFVQRGLETSLAAPVQVLNMGERGYVSTQGLIRLMLELRAGHIPDVAIFYDGFNDVAAAFSDEPGAHYAEVRIAGRLDRPLSTLLLTSRTANLALRITGHRFNFEHLQDQSERRQLTEGIVEVYLGNLEVAEALARAYGFTTYFFWQPSLLGSSKPEAGVEGLLRREQAPGWAALLRQVNERINEVATTRDHLHSLATALDRETEPLYIDEVHVTPRANEILAAAMLEVLVPHLQPSSDHDSDAAGQSSQ